MTEYEMKIKEAANDIKYLRTSTGAMYSQMIFSLISIMLAKRKITKEELEIILEVERSSIKESVKSYAESNYGQENSAITRTEDMKEVEKICLRYVEEIKKMILEVAKQISTPKRARKRKKRIVKKDVNNLQHKIIPSSKVKVEIFKKSEK